MASVQSVRDRDIAGSFAALTDDQVLIFLDDAAARLNPDGWGNCFDLAHVYLTMHLLTIAANGTVAGPMTSASAGGVSVSFSAGRPGASTTQWGQMFDALAVECGVVGPVVVTGTPLYC